MRITPGREYVVYYERAGFRSVLLRLLADGVVANRPGHAEVTWEVISDGSFVFRDRDGRTTARLEPRDNCYEGTLLGRYSARLRALGAPDESQGWPVIDSLHGTHPLVLHACGVPRNPALDLATKLLLAAGPLEFGSPSNLTVLTWSNQLAPTPLEKCLSHLGVPCLILRPEPAANWVNALKNHLTAEGMREVSTDYVLGMDALDVALLAPPSAVLGRFLALTTGARAQLPGCRMLFNAELNSFPDRGRVMEIERKLAQEAGEMPFAHFNSGVFVGETSACLKWYTFASRLPCMRGARSDQGVLRSFYLDTEGEIRIDRRCDIFQTALPRQGVRIRSGTVPAIR